MRTISIGAQGFTGLRENNYFYVDKTSFIKEWWESADDVTLITRPRRFGKTLNMDMLNCFFSNRYEGRSDLFEGLDIWKEEKYRTLQGSYPVIFLSFADVKGKTFAKAREMIVMTIQELFTNYRELWENDSDQEKAQYNRFMELNIGSTDAAVSKSLRLFSNYLHNRYGKKVLIFLDEYDTPLQEAYVDGYWDEISEFIRGLFNSTFKTNLSLERAVMTGVTRVSKESVFSDLNNLNVITTTDVQYQTAFGFTDEEVRKALEEYGLADQREQVKAWYDGFTFGNTTDIYNPWSITNFLKKRKLEAYWAGTSSNDLISSLIQKGDADIKDSIQELLDGGNLKSRIDEEIVFSDLDKGGAEHLWSLMLASGYLRFVSLDPGDYEYDLPIYTLTITNGETRMMFSGMIRRWFEPAGRSNDEFIKAMIKGDVQSMNRYMNDIALTTFSSFDAGKKASASKPPESFYHGFVLGLLVRERERYDIKSNRESGYGRYDIAMVPKKKHLPGIIMEFKVFDKEYDGEEVLEDTAENALKQIQEKKYAADLEARGISDILLYGFAFAGKQVLIRKGDSRESRYLSGVLHRF